MRSFVIYGLCAAAVVGWFLYVSWRNRRRRAIKDLTLRVDQLYRDVNNRGNEHALREHDEMMATIRRFSISARELDVPELSELTRLSMRSYRRNAAFFRQMAAGMKKNRESRQEVLHSVEEKMAEYKATLKRLSNTPVIT